MRAAWYERPGQAAEVFEVGEMATPEPQRGEVRVRLSVSGINPGDTKKREDWLGLGMPFPRIIPHSDGAGIIDAVGDEVPRRRVGQRVWVYGAQSYRPFGTAAQFTVVPSALAVELPDEVSDEIGACLGIPGVTAHRCVFSDGSVAGKTVLVQGVLGGVGSLAAQLARRAGAMVIGTVRWASDFDAVHPDVADQVVALDGESPVEAIRAFAPGGVDRIVEVSLSDNAALDASVVASYGVVAAYSTRSERPEIPFWPLLFSNVTVCFLGSDDFPVAAKREAADALTAAAREGALTIPVAEPVPLAEIAAAHDRVGAGTRERVLLAIPE